VLDKRKSIAEFQGEKREIRGILQLRMPGFGGVTKATLTLFLFKPLIDNEIILCKSISKTLAIGCGIFAQKG
jgi:hypothetical protein